MQSHKFKAGAIVSVSGSATRKVPAGRYEIVRPLPANDADLQYRVKAIDGGQEWILTEGELVG